MPRPATIAAPYALLAALVLAACGGEDAGDPAAAGPCEPATDPPPREVNLDPPPARPEARRLTAVVETTCGTFEIRLDTRENPKTAASFAYLAENGVYDDTAIQRISIAPPLIQAGDPTGTRLGDAGYHVDEPPPPDTAYTRGVVAMAKTSSEPPGRSGSQFFIVTAADAGLPPDYAVAGRVSEGFGVVRTISQFGDPSGQTEEPLEPVVIRSVTVERR